MAQPQVVSSYNGIESSPDGFTAYLKFGPFTDQINASHVSRMMHDVVKEHLIAQGVDPEGQPKKAQVLELVKGGGK